jgi:ribonuclease HI
MELKAVLKALEYLKQSGAKDPIEIFTDSQYVMRGMTEWLPRWKERHWFTASGEPVKNRELWEGLSSLQIVLRPKWIWVRGHKGHPENEFCDTLVNEEMNKFLIKK